MHRFRKTTDDIDEDKFCRLCRHPLADHRPQRGPDGWYKARVDTETGKILCRWPTGLKTPILGEYRQELLSKVKEDLDAYQMQDDARYRPSNHEGLKDQEP